jgi:hypothetical protein
MVSELEREEADERPDTEAIGHIAVSRANAERLPGAFKMLTLEHVRLLELLLQLQHAQDAGRPPQPLLDNAISAINAHEDAESAVLEPRLSQHPKTRHYMAEHEDSAFNLRRVAAQLRSLVGGPDYARTLKQFVRTFQQYSRHEETELFVAGQHALDANDPLLQQEYEQAIMKSPSPSA